MKMWTAHTVSALVERLRERKRLGLAARALQTWMTREAKAGRPPDRHNLMRLGGLLRAAGDPVKAADALRQAVHVSMNGNAPDGLLIMILGKLAECLDEAGDRKSAAETRELRDRVCKAYREHPDTLKTLAPTEVLIPAASRCTFILSMDWESAGETLSTFEEDGFTLIRDRIRLDETSSTWIEFEVKAPADPEPQYPHVEVCARLPSQFAGVVDLQPVLGLVNEINQGNSAVSTCLDARSGQLLLRSRIAFSGFNEGTDELSTLRHAHTEIAINLMLEVLTTASGWAQRVAELADRLDAPDAPAVGGGTFRDSPATGPRAP